MKMSHWQRNLFHCVSDGRAPSPFATDYLPRSRMLTPPEERLTTPQWKCNDSSETERSNLLRELELSLRSTNAIQARINALSAISRLQDEVLLEVFHSLAAIQPPGSAKQPIPRVLNLGWILVTHVCRRWRYAALDNSTLWSHISFALGSEWTARMLERSRVSPLVIQASGPGRDLPPNLGAQLRPYLSRTRVLELYAQIDTLEEILTPLVEHAPILQSLRLRADRGDEPSVISPTPNFLSLSTPNLRRVRLENVFIPWTSPIFQNPEHLQISLPVFDQDDWLGEDVDRPWDASLPGFLAMLEATPGLKSLHLDNAIPSISTMSSQALDHTSTVSLPDLVDLTLKGMPADAALLLHHLELPGTARFAFTGSSEIVAADYQILFLSIRGHLLRTRPNTPTIIEIEIRDRLSTSLVCAYTFNHSTQTKVILFSINFPCRMRRLPGILPLLFSIVLLDHPFSLRFTGGHFLIPQDSDWRPVFRGLRSVRSFEASKDDVTPYLKTLQVEADEDVIFPDLEVLAILHFVWIGEDADSNRHLMQEQIFTVLQSRLPHARKLQKLVLRDVNAEGLDADWIARLQPFVSEVVTGPYPGQVV
ncbi:hypothetical protein EVG20_g4325 [Dentipellis fragilis]|uniref:F-box domain-containing protein n=1 Tax=Dentipellis fragilis TaxID=205917 RepID=A0A4Y9YVZ3_9AGAM|nr:hypothetical protein EVG20_g4325 [Dentipellis fragilis]